MVYTNILIIGSGIAGLCAAYEAASAGARVLVVSKGTANASVEVMGFNAYVHPDDNEILFYKDTLASGEGICNQELVGVLVRESVKRIAYMEELGLTFARNGNGTYNGMRALGNSYPRIVHYLGTTGHKSMELLRQACLRHGVKFLEGFRISDLLTDGQTVYGAVGYDNASGSWSAISAGATVLATGGCGAVHPVSTYPPGLTGDGYAMAYRAGAALVDMEFMQYEPCCFIYPEQLVGNIIVTTMLNEGGRLLNRQGEEFMLNTPLGYSVQKGALSRAIAREIARGNGSEHGGVYMDVTTLPADRINVDCSLFSGPARAVGIDMTTDVCEVAPAAHTFMGGVVIDQTCRTSLYGLFAAGEVIGGLHGANRLGGNAGAEVYTFGTIAGQSAVACWQDRLSGAAADKELAKDLAEDYRQQQDAADRCTTDSVKLCELIDIIGKSLGIFRDGSTMEQALKTLEGLEEYTLCGSEGLTYRNMLLLAKLQLLASLERKESRGVFYRTDYPDRDENNWKKNIYLQKAGEECHIDIRNTVRKADNGGMGYDGRNGVQ